MSVDGEIVIVGGGNPGKPRLKGGPALVAGFPQYTTDGSINVIVEQEAQLRGA